MGQWKEKSLGTEKVTHFSYLVDTDYTFFLDNSANTGTHHWVHHRRSQVMSPRSHTRTSGSLGNHQWSDCTCDAHTDYTEDLLFLLGKDTVLLICHTAESHLLSQSYHNYRTGRGKNYFAAGWSIPPNIDCTVSLQRGAYSGIALSACHRQSQGGTQLGCSHRPCNW